MSPDANARPKFYLRDGSLADERVWEDKQGDPAYVQIDKATIPSGYWVSTIWVGIDHDPSPAGPPLIFETVVFEESTKKSVDRARYATEAEARAGHQRLVDKWTPPAAR